MRPHTSVAEFIRQRQVEIMAGWDLAARTAASARGLSAPAFTNVMPVFLASLADETHPDATARRRDHVLTHLATRIRQGFELTEMIDEFHVLEHCIMRTWADVAQEDRPPDADVERMRSKIHDAVTQVTDAFFHHMFEDEQAEKRYLRLLQDIATRELHADAPLEHRVRVLLEVVVDAMVARSAAFLLFDTQANQLITIACCGDEAFEAYATSLDPKSFAGQVAGNERPTSMDVTTTPLEVPASLRKAGIHSVLGVRVPRRSDLLGILYIGVAETRAFSPREVHRLELLADRLALHLENARLVSSLHETIESLRVERGLRETFVAILAHDLRGPLSAARLAAEILAGESVNLDKRHDLAIRVDRNLERVDEMIRNLLDANRIRAGEVLPLRVEACDLCAIARQIADEARALYGDRFIVDCNSARGIWSPDELYRALWNLVTNAVKYGDPKLPITITVTVGHEAARVSVHNFGEPIPASELPYLFEPFRRATKADSGPRLGWGLGLTLVRGCATAHGGRADVTSDRNGTTFAMELPLDATPFQRAADGEQTATVH